jgi:hypothetical protein
LRMSISNPESWTVCKLPTSVSFSKHYRGC